MKLIKLTFGNIKSFKSYMLDAKGLDLLIKADNGKGKTTLFDGYSWLLWSKDSEGKSDQKFDIKTLDLEGQAAHNLEHFVEGVFELSDKTKITFKHTMIEDYVTKSGTADRQLKGHTHKYSVNLVPVQLNEYNERLNQICPPDRWKILSDPREFPDRMPWETRRSILLDMAGNLDLARVIASSDKLKELPVLLGSYSVAEYEKIGVERRKLIKDSQTLIPNRIDEANRALQEVEGFTESSLKADRDKNQGILAQLQEQRAGANSGGLIATENTKLANLDTELIQICNVALATPDPAYEHAEAELSRLAREVKQLERDQQTQTDQIDGWKEQIKRLTDRKDALLIEYKAVKAEQFEGSLTCPSCGQAFAPDKVQEVTEAFNIHKSERLEKNIADGKSIAPKILEIQGFIEQALGQIEHMRERHALALEESQKIDLPKIENRPDPKDSPAYKAKKRDRDAQEAKIVQMRADSSTQLANLDEQIRAARSAVSLANEGLSKLSMNATTQKRIDELGVELKTISTELEQVEHGLFLCDEYTRVRCRMLTELINGFFKVVQFRLFVPQINGGIKEVCDVMVNGVPYASLNHAARINAGLDCINVLADHFGFAPPVWIDYAESVTAPVLTRGQQIRLSVLKGQNTLDVSYVARAQDPELF